MCWVEVKEFVEEGLCWISSIAYVEERTHTDTDRPRERERELEGGTDAHTQLQKTDDVGACSIFVGCFGIHQHQSCNCRLAQHACSCPSLLGRTRAYIFVGVEMVRPSVAPCAHCGRPLHPIPDQSAGQKHCNSGRRVKAHVLQVILLPALVLFYVQNFAILQAA